MAGVHHGRHRLPRLQAAGHRQSAGRAGADAGACAALSRRSQPGAGTDRGRLRESPRSGEGDHARGARRHGCELRLKPAEQLRRMSESRGLPLGPPLPVAGGGSDGTAQTSYKVRGELLTELPSDLYIPPDALEVFLDTFEGPLDLLLYLIRKANVDTLDIPMASLTLQYLDYVEAMRTKNLELAAEYLVMAAMLMEIKSRMLLPRPRAAGDDDQLDPRAELVRRLLEYEQMKAAARRIDELPQRDREFGAGAVWLGQAGVR